MAQTADRDANHALRTRFDEVHGQYQRLRAGMGQLQQQLSTLSVSSESRDGLVRAKVGPRGELVDLHLDPRVLRMGDADALARTIVATVQRAAADTAERVQELVGQFVPPDSGALRFLRDGDFGDLLKRQDRLMRDGDGRDD